MACYYGFETSPNKAMWVIFVLSLVAGLIMLPLGLARFVPCYNNYNSCLERYPGIPENDWNNPCRGQLESCGVVWARVFIAGIILLVIASVPQCYFACCARPPIKQNQNGVPTAVALQPYPPPPGGYAMQQPGAYQPVFQPVPAGPQAGGYVAGQPYQQGVQFYPVPPGGQLAVVYGTPVPPAPQAADGAPPPGYYTPQGAPAQQQQQQPQQGNNQLQPQPQ